MRPGDSNGYRSLGLLVANATTTFDVLSYSWGRLVPGGVRLRAPEMGTLAEAELPDGCTEIAAHVLDAQGRVLDTFGWTSTPREFHDHFGPKCRIRGFATTSESRARAFVLRIRNGAVSVAFWLLRKGAAPQRLRQIPLHRKLLRSPVTPHGRIDLRRSRLIKDRAPRFDIVVTGDGFAQGDVGRFLRTANGLIKGLKSMEPFRSLDEKINYHTLVAVSEESGITDVKTFPKGPRKTYFHSRTEFENPTFREAIGTPYPELIKNAVKKIRPWHEIDLVIVIANVELSGGYAFRQHGTVFVARNPKHDMWYFVQLVAHEGGHVIAKLADEYISGSGYDSRDAKGRPNVATARQVRRGLVPWTHLAKAKGELRPSGKLKLVHKYDGAWNLATKEPKLAEEDMSRIGAFWGCMYTRSEVSPEDVSDVDDPRGKHFYRPSARCIMRNQLRYDRYCAVCLDAVARAIEKKARKGREPMRRRAVAPSGGYPPSKMPMAARPPQRD